MFDANSPTARALQPNVTDGLAERVKTGGAGFLWGALRRRAGALWESFVIEAGSRLALLDRFRFRVQAVQAAWMKAVRHHHMQPLEVDVLLLRAKVRDGGVVDESNGWKDFVLGKLTTIAVEGDHATHVAPPFIQETALLLRNELESVRKRYPSPHA